MVEVVNITSSRFWLSTFQFVNLARLENCLLPLLGLTAGYYFVKADSTSAYVLSVVALVLVHTIVTVWNDMSDEKVDRLNGQSRIAAARSAKTLPIIRFYVLINLTLLIIVSYHLNLAGKLVMALFLLIGWLYNSRPVLASHRPISSIVLLAATYGALPVILGATIGDFNVAALVLALGLFLTRGSLSLLKDYKDVVGDAQVAKKTFLLRYGQTLTRRLSFGFAAIGSATIIGTVFIETGYTWLMGALLLASVGLLVLRRQLFLHDDYAALNKVFHQCLSYQLLVDGLVIACLRLF